MEVTNGLISNLVQTKSIQRVLAPIASQVSLLILLNESSNRNEGSPPTDMADCAGSVVKAADDLINVAKRRIEYTNDQLFKEQMTEACETLDVAGQSLILAAHRLESEFENRDARKGLVQAGKDVLQSIMKVLLVSDDREVRGIVVAAECVKSKAAVLDNVEDIKDLIEPFKRFANSAAYLTQLAGKREKDLCNQGQREKLITAMTVLKKTAQPVMTALQTFIKYPDNFQAQANKSSVIKQITSTVDDIVDIIHNKMPTEYIDSDEPGFFVTRLDWILDSLSDDKRFVPCLDFDIWVEAAVRHSMIVAHLCSDSHRDFVIKTCHRILQLKQRVEELQRLMKVRPLNDEMRCDYEDVCEHLMDEFCDLEKHVNMTILYLIIEVLKETTGPLERLLKAATTQPPDESLTDILVEQFCDHADKLCQIAVFAASSSTHVRRVRSIHASVGRLERLDPEIVPVVMSLTKDPLNPATMQHLKLMVKEWRFEMSNVIKLLDEMTDPKTFMAVTVRKVSDDICILRGFISAKDVAEIVDSVKPMVGRARRVTQMIHSFVDNHVDPVYRNGLLVYVKQLQKAITGVKDASSQMGNNGFTPTVSDTLSRRVNLLLDCLHQLKDALSKHKHLDLLNPLRRTVRKQVEEDEKHTEKQHQKPGEQTEPSSKYLSSDVPPRIATTKNQLPPSQCDKTRTNPTEKGIVRDRKMQVTAKRKQNVAGNKLRELCSVLMTSAVEGKKDKLKCSVGEILGWTNHIVECAQSLITSEDDDEKLREMKALADEVDSITPNIIDSSYYVKHGDEEKIDLLQELIDKWIQKTEKLRIIIDVTTEEWKGLVEELIDCLQTKNNQVFKTKLDNIARHQTSLCSIMLYCKDINLDDSTADYLPLCVVEKMNRVPSFLDDLENLTVTIKTMTDVLHQSGERIHSEKNKVWELEQLGREWAVCIYCIISTLNSMHQQVAEHSRSNGIHVFTVLLSDSEKVSTLEKENKRLKKMYFSVTDRKNKREAGLIDEIENSFDAVKQNLTNINSNPDTLYTKELKESVYTIWLIKALKVINAVNMRTQGYNSVVLAFVNRIDDYRAQESVGGQRLSSKVQLECSHFSDNFMTVRQKVLRGIQLSTDLEKRGVVKKCLDELTSLAPQIIEAVKSSSDKNTVSAQSLERYKQEWAANCRLLVKSLQDMPQVKSTLPIDISKLLLTTNHGTDNYSDATVADTKSEFQSLHTEFEEKFEKMSLLKSLKEDAAQSSGNASFMSPYRKSVSASAAAIYLQKEAEKWEDDHNPIVKVAKEMSEHMLQLEHLSNEEDFNKNKYLEAIQIAKSISDEGLKIWKFAKALANHSIDRRVGEELMSYGNKILTSSKQLNIISSVLISSSPSHSAHKVLSNTAENVMKTVTETLTAAQAVCVKGLNQPDEFDSEEAQAVILAIQWQQQLHHHRKLEANSAEKDELGLRIVDNYYIPTLTEILQRR